MDISPARFRRLSFSFALVYSCFLRPTGLTRFPSRYTFDEVTAVHYPGRSFIAVIYDYYYCTVMATAVAWRPHIEKLFLLQRKRVEHYVTKAATSRAPFLEVIYNLVKLHRCTQHEGLVLIISDGFRTFTYSRYDNLPTSRGHTYMRTRLCV